MHLDPFLRQLERDVTTAAHAGDESVQAAAARLTAALDPAARLVLLDVLVSAADELTLAAGVTVEVRLRGREVELVLDSAPGPMPDLASPDPALGEPAVPSGLPLSPGESDELTARVSLRLPDALKTRAEARAATAGISLNTWIVRAVAAATATAGDDGPRRRRGGRGTHLTGWSQS